MTDIPLTMPRTLTAHTGMDALTHAIEAYVAGLHSDFSDPLALKAIQMIFDYLPASYNGDETARRKMHVAQCLAGMAFSNALLGIAHPLAHKTGAAVCHIPHGCCNAILLPNVIRYNSKACLSRYADIARYIGLTGKDDQELTDKLVEKVEQLNKTVDTAPSFREHRRDGRKVQQHHRLCQHSRLSAIPAAGSDPASQTSPEDLKKILICCLDGKKVDF